MLIGYARRVQASPYFFYHLMTGNALRLDLYARLAHTLNIDRRQPMATTETIKQQRMHIRLDALSKQKLERAAAYAHKTLSEFVLGKALNAADEVLHEHETLTLNQLDREVFFSALENPPRPNARLKQAFAEHKHRVKQ